MALRGKGNFEATLKVNPDCRPDREINILLMGPTGVGKTTFINALGNYFVNDSLAAAVRDDMQVIIPSSFSYTGTGSDEDQDITFGQRDGNENPNSEVQSATQQCRSYVFPLGDRNLRLIDTPGIGDTRGVQQDSKNFHEILTFIAQYEHLNAVCLLLKPNEERLTVIFRFCINELLRHLHVSAADNLLFVFTNARTTFFMPGNTKRVLQALLDQHRTDFNVTIPFSQTNTFLFDSEPFRYLAIRKHGIELDLEQTKSYTSSWDRSVQECIRLIRYVVSRPLHAVSNTLSLNEAEQLVRKLPRPIAETANLIEQNIQLAQDHKRKVLENSGIAEQGIPQNEGRIIALAKPRTVCVSERCCRMIEVNGEKKIDYISKCHDECYLTGVEQEKIADEKLSDCTAMDALTGERYSRMLPARRLTFFLSILGFCLHCRCPWVQHMHITYEYRTSRTQFKPRTARISLNDIDQRIRDLRGESAKIQEVYKQIAAFLYANSILPINESIIEYLKYFIREAQMKQDVNVVAGLEKMMEEVSADLNLLKTTVEEQKASGGSTAVIQPSDIFTLVSTLYDLPITGGQIRQQVQGIQFSQQRQTNQRDRLVTLPRKAATSQVMRESMKVIKDL